MEYEFAVIAETEQKGYVVRLFKHIESATLLYKNMEILFDYTLESIPYLLKRFKKYPLNNDSYVYSYHSCISSGNLTIYIIQFGEKWCNLEHFIADRMFVPPIFEMN